VQQSVEKQTLTAELPCCNEIVETCETDC